MSLVAYRCPQCGCEVEAVPNATVTHASCPKRAARSVAPVYEVKR